MFGRIKNKFYKVLSIKTSEDPIKQAVYYFEHIIEVNKTSTPVMILTDIEKQTKLHTFETAIEALKKQIPMKPAEQANEFDEIDHKCPACGSLEIVKHCANCGQKIDWDGVK